MVFGLNVEENDNNFSAISKLLKDIDVNLHLIHSIYYLKTKNGQTPIKLVTYDVPGGSKCLSILDKTVFEYLSLVRLA